MKAGWLAAILVLLVLTKPAFADCQEELFREQTDYLYMILMDETAQWIKIYDSDIWTSEQLSAQLERLRSVGCKWDETLTQRLEFECEQLGGRIEAEKVFLYLFEDGLGSYDSWETRDLYQYELVLKKYGLIEKMEVTLPAEELISAEEAYSIALDYLITRKDLSSVPIQRAQLVACEMDYKYIDKSNRKEWIVGFTLKEPIWDWRGFAVRISAEKGNVKEFIARYVQLQEKYNSK